MWDGDPPPSFVSTNHKFIINSKIERARFEFFLYKKVRDIFRGNYQIQCITIICNGYNLQDDESISRLLRSPERRKH